MYTLFQILDNKLQLFINSQFILHLGSTNKVEFTEKLKSLFPWLNPDKVTLDDLLELVSESDGQLTKREAERFIKLRKIKEKHVTIF